MTDGTTFPFAYGYPHQHHQHNWSDHGRRDYGVGVEDLVLANQIAAGHQQLGDKIHTASVNGIRETSQAARDTTDAVRDSINATNQIGNINLQSTERNGGETRSNVERSAGEVRDAVHFSANQAARDAARNIEELCHVRREVSDGFGNTNLEFTKQHAQIQLEMCKQHAELARQIDARAAEAAKQLAECCCKLEGEHATTRQLIQANALADCERRASDLQNEVNLLRIGVGGNGPGPFRQ